MKIHLVGGAVRDMMLDKIPADRDYVVVGSTPVEMLSREYKQVGADFPVFLHPETGDEYALARIERKSGTGYHGFTVDASDTVTLEEDLERRDLTINSMAFDEDGTLIDPFGGKADLDAGIIRHTSDAFKDDPVRALRACRFAARYSFTIHPSTVSMIRTMVADGELNHLTPERTWAELEKGFDDNTIHIMFRWLRETGVLAAVYPEMELAFKNDKMLDTQLSREVLCGWPKMSMSGLMCLLTPHFEQTPCLYDRYKMPSEVKDTCLIFHALKTTFFNFVDLSASQIANAFRRADIIRKPDRFHTILLALNKKAIDSLEDMQSLDEDKLRQCAIAFNISNAGEIANACSKPKDIGSTIFEARVQAVQQVLDG